MKLSIKLALYITVMAIIVSAMVTLASFLSIQKRIELSAHSSVSALAQTVYSMATTAAYVGDAELAREVVAGLQYNNEIICARIVAPALPLVSNEACRTTPLVERRLYSPWDDSEVVGVLKVYKDAAYLKALAQEQAVSELINLITLIMFMSIATMVLTYFLITRPIERVSTKVGEVRFEAKVHLLEEGARKDEIGNIGRMINLLLINAKKQIITEQFLARKSEDISRHFKLIFELSKDYLAVTDGQLRLQSFNPKFSQLMTARYDKGAVLGTDEWLIAVSSDPDSLRRSILTEEQQEVPVSLDLETHSIVGDERINLFYNLTFVKSHSSDRGETVLIFINDITEQREKLLKTEYEANHDNLTKIFNRLAATRKVRYLLSEIESGEQVAILFIDLDGFKAINDELGHDAGDDILKSVAKRLSESTRKTDIVCRWGGDEFLVALSCVNYQQALGAANKILNKLVEPVVVNCVAESRSVGASIGMALSNDEVSDFATLYDRADQAMYEVKKAGKNAVKVYDDN